MSTASRHRRRHRNAALTKTSGDTSPVMMLPVTAVDPDEGTATVELSDGTPHTIAASAGWIPRVGDAVPFVRNGGDLVNLAPAIMVDGAMQSRGYDPGVAGWSIDADGNVEFADGTFRGDIVAASIVTTGGLGIGLRVGRQYDQGSTTSIPSGGAWTTLAVGSTLVNDQDANGSDALSFVVGSPSGFVAHRPGKWLAEYRAVWGSGVANHPGGLGLWVDGTDVALTSRNDNGGTLGSRDQCFYKFRSDGDTKVLPRASNLHSTDARNCQLMGLEFTFLGE